MQINFRVVYDIFLTTASDLETLQLIDIYLNSGRPLSDVLTAYRYLKSESNLQGLERLKVPEMSRKLSFNFILRPIYKLKYLLKA